jgi:hypothetical protein
VATHDPIVIQRPAMRPADEGLCAMRPKKPRSKKQNSHHAGQPASRAARRFPTGARAPARRAEPRRDEFATVPKLLHARREAAHMLGGVSVATLIRLEKSGRLHPVKLDASKRTGQTYYARAELEKLASGSNAGDPPRPVQTVGGGDAQA